MTKKQMINAFERYEKSCKYSIRDCYKTCSEEKHKAERYHFNEMLMLKGYDFKIISYNSSRFTCGYCRRLSNGVEVFRYITPLNVYEVPIMEIYYYKDQM